MEMNAMLVEQVTKFFGLVPGPRPRIKIRQTKKKKINGRKGGEKSTIHSRRVWEARKIMHESFFTTLPGRESTILSDRLHSSLLVLLVSRQMAQYPLTPDHNERNAKHEKR